MPSSLAAEALAQGDEAPGSREEAERDQQRDQIHARHDCTAQIWAPQESDALAPIPAGNSDALQNAMCGPSSFCTAGLPRAPAARFGALRTLARLMLGTRPTAPRGGAFRASGPTRCARSHSWTSRCGSGRCSCSASSAWAPSTRSCWRARGFEDPAMIYLTVAITAFLFAYLFTALVRPEWF